MPGALDIRRAEMKARKEQEKRNAEAEKAADAARTDAEAMAEAEAARQQELDEMHARTTISTRPDLTDELEPFGKSKKNAGGPPENKSETATASGTTTAKRASK